uniref:Uncharacterized protein n=1 Tax=Anguilla anguilla TaxID=7936 RepID=A0A0E9PCR5_ANGAN
MHLAPASGKV